MNTFYQSYSYKDYSAKVTIEWNTPKGAEIKLVEAEDIADEILSFSAPKMRAMVRKMVGLK